MGSILMTGCKNQTSVLVQWIVMVLSVWHFFFFKKFLKKTGNSFDLETKLS